jgi:heat shock protein HtpX
LLRGMTRDEIAGILAHEVAHIRNNDIWTMSWAAALHRSIEWTSLAGLALLRATWWHGGQPAVRRTTARRAFDRSVASLGTVAHPRAGRGCPPRSN